METKNRVRTSIRKGGCYYRGRNILYYVEKVKRTVFITEHQIDYVNEKDQRLGLRFRMNHIDFTDPGLHLTYESARTYANSLYS